MVLSAVGRSRGLPDGLLALSGVPSAPTPFPIPYAAISRIICSKVNAGQATDQARGPDRAAGAQRAAPGRAGLVPIGSSDTVPSGELTIWAREARVRRASRSIRTSARVIAEDVGPLRPIMVTMTYAPGIEWAAGHVTEFVKRVREWCARQALRVFSYVWCAELQSRGAVHYHVLIWLPRRVTLPKPDRRGWWAHGMTRTERARNAVAYIAKYASKLESKSGDRWPRGIRMHGAGGLSPAGRIERRWWMAPSWARVELADDPESPTIFDLRRWRGGGGGYVRYDTGQLARSPWEFVSRGKGDFGPYVVLRRKVA